AHGGERDVTLEQAERDGVAPRGHSAREGARVRLQGDERIARDHPAGGQRDPAGGELFERKLAGDPAIEPCGGGGGHRPRSYDTRARRPDEPARGSRPSSFQNELRAWRYRAGSSFGGRGHWEYPGAVARRQRSAGILPVREVGGELEVFLVHPGGPFFAKKDAGAWSIAKGAIDEGEDPLAAATRGLVEETGGVL